MDDLRAADVWINVLIFETFFYVFCFIFVAWIPALVRS